MNGERTALGRYRERGDHEFGAVAGILDEALVCHVGFVNDEQPIVLPTIHARIGRALYVHGSVLARWMNGLAERRVCVSVTLVDGIVFARSAFQHTMNYRSAVAFGTAHVVDDPRERLDALHAIVERVCPGRWDDVRLPTVGELRTTLVLRVPIDEASAKVRAGPPHDFESDCAGTYWAGVVPLHTVHGEPIPDPTLASGIGVPPYLRR